MKLLINPRYQYFLLPFTYPIIGLVSVLNYFQLKKYKYSIITLLVIGIWLIANMIIPVIIVENFKIEKFWLSVPGLLYSESLNIVIGYLLIRNQKRNIKFS